MNNNEAALVLAVATDYKKRAAGVEKSVKEKLYDQILEGGSISAAFKDEDKVYKLGEVKKTNPKEEFKVTNHSAFNEFVVRTRKTPTVTSFMVKDLPLETIEQITSILDSTDCGYKVDNSIDATQLERDTAEVLHMANVNEEPVTDDGELIPGIELMQKTAPYLRFYPDTKYDKNLELLMKSHTVDEFLALEANNE